MGNVREFIDTTSSKIDQGAPVAPDLIAQLAYEKWQQRGCPLWDDEQDWFAAQTELEAKARSRS